MSNKITHIDIDDDDKTVFQTEEDLKKIKKEIFGLTDDDTTEIDITG